MTTISMTSARSLYTAANNKGEGYDPDAETVDAAAEAMGGEIILERHTSDDVALVLNGKVLTAIGGDAMGRNAWAIDVVSPRKIKTLRSEAAEAGDMAQVAICDRAVDGDREAILECARVMADVAAQA